jgi:hypothetical protein
MRRNEWVLLSAFALLTPLAACKHSEQTGSSVTNEHKGMSDAERAEAQQNEAVRTEAAHERSSDETASADKPASEPNASGLATDASSPVSIAGGDRDMIATLTPISPVAKIEGMVGLKENKDGAQLIIHIADAEPGRYAIQILDVGTCAPLTDSSARDTEETTGEGMTHGSKTAAQLKKIIARVDVKENRTGHAELALSRSQLGTGDIDNLQQHLVVLREDKQTAPLQGTIQSTPPDTSIMACGTLAPGHAG